MVCLLGRITDVEVEKSVTRTETLSATYLVELAVEWEATSKFVARILRL